METSEPLAIYNDWAGRGENPSHQFLSESRTNWGMSHFPNKYGEG